MNTSWDILKILSDPTRLRLLALVMREELSVAELQEILGMGQSRISSQLALLRTVNLVADRREGKNAFYSFRTNQQPKTLALIKAARPAAFPPTKSIMPSSMALSATMSIGDLLVHTMIVCADQASRHSNYNLLRSSRELSSVVPDS